MFKALHDLIVVEAKGDEDVVDEYGDVVSTGWQQILQQRAHFQYLRAGESVQAARLQGQQPAVVTIRANALSKNIRANQRLRDVRRQITYNIKGAVLTDDRRYVEITCVSGIPDAG